MKVKYKIKKLIPMAMIAGATLLPASSSCCKCEEHQPHHNTTYVWGWDYWDEVVPADKVAASADSSVVDYVILKNDGKSLHASTPTYILRELNRIIENVDPKNAHKIRGAGTLTGIIISRSSARNYADSTTLANMGFTFGLVSHVK